MKKKILIISAVIFVIVLAIAASVITHAYELWHAVNTVSEAQAVEFVKTMKERGSNWWAGSYDGEIERGIVVLGNGELVRFAFISHHVSRDKNSHAYFQGSRYKKNVRGWFCCEVEFGHHKQPQNIDELETLLSKYDGSSP